MGNKIKIHEIAKKIGVTSKEALERAKALGMEVSSHLSGIEEDEAKRIEESFKNGNIDKTKKQREIKQKNKKK